jgi:hypothetical protein
VWTAVRRFARVCVCLGWVGLGGMKGVGIGDGEREAGSQSVFAARRDGRRWTSDLLPAIEWMKPLVFASLDPRHLGWSQECARGGDCALEPVGQFT